MFEIVAFDREINNLIRDGERERAEERLLKAYSELKAADSAEDLEYVISQLAHFYSTPGAENLEKAEAYFLESELALPGSGTKYQTAMFYFYVLGDFPKTITKVNEIEGVQDLGDRASYYSALTLKGQALIRLEKVDAADKVLEEVLSLIKTNPLNLPYGDEINLLQVANQTRFLRKNPARY